jgi:uncharacterized protein (DUF488 family)
MTNSSKSPIRLFTIGHSNRTLDALLAMFKEFAIRTVADIRFYPSSRKFPHFNREPLQASLADNGISYIWLGKELGGRREGLKGVESPNLGLENLQFRNYADYMMTPDFRHGIERLLVSAARASTALMCAEAVYWRCHRRLVSDYLAAQGLDVQHILGSGQLRPHELMDIVQVNSNGTITYPAPLFPQSSSNSDEA